MVKFKLQIDIIMGQVAPDYKFLDLHYMGYPTFGHHTEKYFRNLIKSNRNQIIFTILRLIWKQTDTVRLVPNELENGEYNLI